MIHTKHSLKRKWLLSFSDKTEFWKGCILGALRALPSQGPCMTLESLHQSTFPSVLHCFKESLSCWKNIFSFEDSRGEGGEKGQVGRGAPSHEK